MSAATLLDLDVNALLGRFNPNAGTLAGARRVERRLSDLKGVFLDESAYALACADGDPLV
jgi:hypothetical protein